MRVLPGFFGGKSEQSVPRVRKPGAREKIRRKRKE